VVHHRARVFAADLRLLMTTPHRLATAHVQYHYAFIFGE